MTNNDILRAIRYMFDLSDIRVAELTSAVDPAFSISREQAQAFLRKEDEEGFAECSHKTLAHFLDGLVAHCRGPGEPGQVRPVEKRVTNNLVLKKLRVALELKDTDLMAILEQAGFPISRSELNALFRQPDHKNFRLCGDQLLRHVLRGLTLRLRGE